jgi:hypothetical protein
MKLAALVVAVVCLVGGAAGCSVVASKSQYPKQYKAFKDRANRACKALFKALDARHPREARAAVGSLLATKPPPDLKQRWEIFRSDVLTFFGTNDVVAERAADALDAGAVELGLDDC